MNNRTLTIAAVVALIIGGIYYINEKNESPADKFEDAASEAADGFKKAGENTGEVIEEAGDDIKDATN